MLTCASFARARFGGSVSVPLDLVLMTALVAIGALSLGVAGGAATTRVALGVGGAAAARSTSACRSARWSPIREHDGPAALFLLMLHGHRQRLGAVLRRPRVRAGASWRRSISPKKTVEGAYRRIRRSARCCWPCVGAWWLPAMPLAMRVLLGVTVVALGIAGDLFESMLKRSAGVKDSSALIPGHGGVLDRIDALLFAAPIYYVVLLR